MADSTTQRHGQDRTRINVNQPHELRDWANKFGVTPEQIEEAVRSVGNQAADVQEHLTARDGASRSAR
jgi:Protein of unknown function (DUF3606)